MTTEQFYDGVYTVIGPPGTGKTTFLARQVQQILTRFSGAFMQSVHPNPLVVCSLTRAAAAEVAGRDTGLSARAVGTLHAHCFRALGTPRILEAKDIEHWNEEHPSWSMHSSDYGKTSKANEDKLDFAAEPAAPGAGDAALGQLELLRHRMTPIASYPRDIREFAELWASFKVAVEGVDFTDLISIAHDTVDSAPGNPAVLMVDEAQDLSTLEYALVRKWGEKARATIIVGDPWQSLYVWRGADPGLFFDPTVPTENRRVLGQSYRVPAVVVHVARCWMEDHLSTYEPIEYRPRSDRKHDDESSDGAVFFSPSTISDPDDAIEHAIEMLSRGRRVMFQASCSYMLTTLISRLRSRFIPFSNPWRRHQGAWNPLRPAKGQSMSSRLMALLVACRDAPSEFRRDWTIGDVYRWSQCMRVRGLMSTGAKRLIEAAAFTTDEDGNKHERFDDPVDDADLVDWFVGCHDTVLGIRHGDVDMKAASHWWLSSLLAAQKKTAEFPVGVVERNGLEAIHDRPRCYVGTIHSFKGAEADDVFVFPDLSRAGYREWVDSATSPEGGNSRDGVARLMYVAMTRTRDTLHLCRNDSRFCAPIRREVRQALESYEPEAREIA